MNLALAGERSLHTGPLDNKINYLACFWRQWRQPLATGSYPDSCWERLKPDSSINPSRMLQRRALTTARGALGAPPWLVA